LRKQRQHGKKDTPYYLKNEISDDTFETIRDSINKAWVLGDGRFKQKIEKKTGIGLMLER